ncbi:MAG: TolC family protein [Opitutus sp.]|nr:TolC family protein [Opitutus sp.]
MLHHDRRKRAPIFLSRLTVAFVSLSALAISGCATPRSEHVERATLGAGLQQRGLGAVRSDGADTKAQLPPGVSIAAGLDESAAVAIALWNNAAFQENLAKLGFARGDLAQAGMLANPTLSVLFPVGARQLELIATLPLEALWLRKTRLAIAEQDAERVARGLVQNGLDLARDVKVGLSDFALADDRAEIAAQAVRVREQMAGLAERRSKLGDASELDLAAARAELERAREEAGRFEQDRVMARHRLSLLLGWPLGDVALSLTALPPSPPPAADLEAKALAARPDLRAAELALESAGKKAGLAESEIFSLSASVKSTTGSGKESVVGPGFALPVPILNQNQPARIRTGAELERAAWSFAGTRDRILTEVREARLKLEQASASLAAYESQVLSSFEKLDRLTRRAYELGELSPLAVQESARQLLLLQLRRAELRAEVRRAWADLERGVGLSRPAISSSNQKSA